MHAVNRNWTDLRKKIEQEIALGDNQFFKKMNNFFE